MCNLADKIITKCLEDAKRYHDLKNYETQLSTRGSWLRVLIKSLSKVLEEEISYNKPMDADKNLSDKTT